MRCRLLAGALLLCACGIPSEGPAMQPGHDCMDCHGRDATSFTAAGTVFGEHLDPENAGVMNVRVHLVGADGREVVVRTNSVGNFYTKETVKFPARVHIEKDGVVQEMQLVAQEGRCNRCHAIPPHDGAEGRIAIFHTEHDEHAARAR